MSDLPAQDPKAWTRLFDLLSACDENIPDAEVDADLLQAGIDMRPAFRRLQQMIEHKKARQQLVQARQTRTSMLDQIRDVVGPKVDDLRAGVREFIDRAFSGPEQVAHFHKLEKAATDDDLKSLLDDLSRLAQIRQPEEKHGPQAE